MRSKVRMSARSPKGNTDGENLDAGADLERGKRQRRSERAEKWSRTHRDQVGDVEGGLDSDDSIGRAVERALPVRPSRSAKCTCRETGSKRGIRTRTLARTLTLIKAAPPVRILGSSVRRLRTSLAWTVEIAKDAKRRALTAEMEKSIAGGWPGGGDALRGCKF